MRKLKSRPAADGGRQAASRDGHISLRGLAINGRKRLKFGRRCAIKIVSECGPLAQSGRAADS